MPSSLLSAADPLSPLVLRSRDLLHLRFQFKNMVLETGADLSDPPPPRLAGISGQTAFICVNFPPQHILEQVQASSSNPSPPPYAAAIARPSQLTFAVPSSMLPVLYRLQDVLSLLTQLTPLAPDEVPADISGTAIEFPVGILLAPVANSQGRLFHRRDEATSSRALVELWHSRLGTVAGDGTLDGAGAPMLQASLTSPPQPEPSFNAPLTGSNRADIAVQSKSKGGRILAEQFALSSLGASISLRSDWPPPAPPTVNLDAWQHRSNLARDYYVRTSTHGFLFPFGHGASLTHITQREFDVPPGFASLVKEAFVTVKEQVRDFDELRSNFDHNGREMPLKRITILSPLRKQVPSAQQTPFQLLFRVAAQDSRRGPEIIFDLPMLYVEKPFDMTALISRYADINSADLQGQLAAIADPDSDDPQAQDTLLKIMTMIFGVETPAALDPPFLPYMLKANVGIPALDRYLGVGATPPITSRAKRAGAPYEWPMPPRGAVNQPPAAAGTTAMTASDSPVVTVTHNFQYLAGASTHLFADIVPTPPLPTLSVPVQLAGGLFAPAFQALDGLSRNVGPTSTVAAPVDPALMLGDVKLFGTIPLRALLAPLGDLTLPSGVPTPDALAKLFDDIDAPDSIDNLNILVPRPILSTVNRAAQSAKRAGGAEAQSPIAASDIETRFIWKPPVNTEKLPPPLGAITTPPQNVILVCKGRLLDASADDKPSFDVVGTLAHFKVQLPIIEVDFHHITFRAGSRRTPSIDPHITGIRFVGDLEFLNALAALLPGGLNSGPPSTLMPAGAFARRHLLRDAVVTVQPSGAIVSFDLAVPSFAIGILAIQNIALTSSLSLPFVEGTPLAVRFGLSERAHPFLVTVAAFGGSGFLGLEVRSDGSVLVEAAIEFGANVAFDIGVAAGGVYLFAGIYFNNDGELTAFIRCGGYLEVLQLVSVSIEFYIGLTRQTDNSLYGTALLTIGVRVLFHSFSITQEVHKKIANLGSGPSLTRESTLVPPPTFEDMVNPNQWQQYCRAFA